MLLKTIEISSWKIWTLANNYTCLIFHSLTFFPTNNVHAFWQFRVAFTSFTANWICLYLCQWDKSFNCTIYIGTSRVNSMDIQFLSSGSLLPNKILCFGKNTILLLLFVNILCTHIVLINIELPSNSTWKTFERLKVWNSKQSSEIGNLN